MKLQLYCHACYAMAIVSESEHQFSHSALTRCPSGTTSMSPWAGHSDACTDASRKPQREQRDGQWFGIGLGSCLLHVCIVLHICCNCALYNLNIFEPQISIYIYILYEEVFFWSPIGGAINQEFTVYMSGVHSVCNAAECFSCGLSDWAAVRDL